jgi:glycine betaine/proline transport system substrate-binding protein
VNYFKIHALKVVMVVFIAAMVVAPLNVYAAKNTIRFTEQSWDSVQVHNRIAGFILEHGYGYGVEYIAGDTIMLMTGLLKGDCDVNMESWTENIQELYDKGIKSGKIADLGSNFPDSWQGWLVPTYMIKGDPARGIKPIAPDLKSVADLSKYWKLFKDPEAPSKGRFYNSLPGWGCTKINSEKLKAYGLDKYYNDFITGSDAALTGSMAAAVKRGKPWVGYYWEPTWVLGKLDMYRLEEPPYSDEVWNKNKACAYKSVQVNILVNTSFMKKYPDVVEMLKNYETKTAMVNEMLAYMQDTKGTADAGAIWFLKNKEDVWIKWVPEDVAKKVKTALAK